MRILDKAHRGWHDVRVLVKYASLLAPILGFYYLSSYLRCFNIPFPLEISVLPTALLVIGVCAISFVLMLSGYLILSSLVQFGIFGVDYAYLVKSDSNGVLTNKGTVLIKNISIIYVSPAITFFAFIFFGGEQASSTLNLILFLVMYLLWALLFSIRMVRKEFYPKKSGTWKDVASIAALVFAVEFFSIASSLIFLALILPRGIVSTWPEMLAAIALYLLTNVVCMTPTYKDDELFGYDKFNKAGLNPTLFVFSILTLLTLMPQVSHYVGELPLKYLNIGAGVERTLLIPIAKSKSFPLKMLGECNKEQGYCVSPRVKLLYGLGRYSYFLYGKRSVRVNADSYTEVIDIPEDSPYLETLVNSAVEAG